MEVTKTLRPWVCALPQPGWGGTTLNGYIEGIGIRPDADGTDEEVARVLDGLVKAGHARAWDDEDGVARWELTEAGHDALTALIDPADGATAAEVLLELQPGITASATSGEVQ